MIKVRVKRVRPRDLLATTVASAVLVLGLVIPQTGLAWEDAEQQPESNQCLVCHLDLDYVPDDMLEDDVHAQAGLSCTDCHGGDANSDDEDVAKSEKAGFIGIPQRGDIPGLCGRCHSDIAYMRDYQPRIATDQVQQYFTSAHGRGLKNGDQRVAVCTSCHTAHGVLGADDSRSTVYALNVPTTCSECHSDSQYMSPYAIRTDQLERFSHGVHGVALLQDKDTGAPACNDCHGNHGASPPGVTSVQQVCGECHVNNMEYFSKTKMAEEFASQDLHGCEECHGNHDIARTSDEMVGVGDDAVCMDCHEEGDDGYTAAAGIHDALMSLVSVYDEAVAKQKEIQRIGMDDVEMGFLLQEAHQSLIQARTLVHTFDPEKVGERTTEGASKVDEAMVLAALQIKEHHVRRRGFGMATIFITLLVVALYLKIRELERA